LKKLYIGTFLIALLFVSSYGFAKDSHHGHGSSDNSKTIKHVMQDMNKNLAELVRAIMQEDYDLIASSADNIANHPSIKQEDLHALFERLGDKKEAFIQCDKAVHDLALSLSKAGEQEDMERVLNSYFAMLIKTVECHRDYR
jgi:alpha-beta hydrolase superfamily lysophospholipase